MRIQLFVAGEHAEPDWDVSDVIELSESQVVLGKKGELLLSYRTEVSPDFARIWSHDGSWKVDLWNLVKAEGQQVLIKLPD